MADTQHHSITTARRYLQYLRAGNKGLKLPEIPGRCVISYLGAAIDLLKARCPHLSCSLGFTNPMELHFFFPEGGVPFAMARGMHGASMASVQLEELIALGFLEFLVIGPAGHPSSARPPALRRGDLLLVNQALIFEGTSAHYGQRERSVPSLDMVDRLRTLLPKLGVTFHEGAVATTDALYRETGAFVHRLVERGALAVDMEMSALLTVAAFHARAIGGLVFISDVVSTLDGWTLGLAAREYERLVGRMAEIAWKYASE